MKRLTFVIFLLSFWSATALPLPPAEWRGENGEAPAPPLVTAGATVRGEATSDGAWQGIRAFLDEELDLAPYSGISFECRQGVYPERADGVLRFDYDRPDGRGHIYTVFNAGAGEWTQVTVPFDINGWQGSDAVRFGTIKSLNIYPFAQWDETGELLEVRNFQLLKRDKTPRELPTKSYSYESAPAPGDEARQRLTDGATDVNVHWPQYGAGEAEILFDLGGIYTVTAITVASAGEPEQNYAAIPVLAGNSPEQMIPAGTIPAPLQQDADGIATASGSMSAVGRYFRLLPQRRRQDFPVNLSEVRFTGYIPDAAEITAAAFAAYPTGPALPEPTEANAVRLTNDRMSLWIDRQTGIPREFYRDGIRLADRLEVGLAFQDRDRDAACDPYAVHCTVEAISPAEALTTTIAKEIPAVTVTRRWQLQDDALVVTETVTETAPMAPVFLRLFTTVILDREFRHDGWYESWGASHTIARKGASEVVMSQAVANIPVLSFENFQRNLTLLHHRARINGRYTNLNIVNEEEPLQSYLPNGWRLSPATVVVGSGKTPYEVETRLTATDGSLLAAYNRYLDDPEAAAFRAEIRRPEWLRDVLLTCDSGWDSLWRGAGVRFARNLRRLYGDLPVIQAALTDLDFTWGELPCSGKVENWFGGAQDAEELKAKIHAIREAAPSMKVAIYTWFWSAFPYTRVVREHPEWFVWERRNGAPASWFPGVARNLLRFWEDPASRREAFDSVMNMVRSYGVDFWYLDGGNVGCYAKSFDPIRLDDPFGVQDLYGALRRELQTDNPESVIFFNEPFNPQGDLGFLESFSGTLTGEWRTGAAWMWKFKLFQHRDPWHYPVYIYWLPSVEGAYQNYLLGTGMMPALNSREQNRHDVAWILARYAVRGLALTDADPQPNWRGDLECMVEVMPLRQGHLGWIFVNPHPGAPETQTVSVATQPMGMKIGETFWHAVHTPVATAKWQGARGLPDLREAYQSSHWRGDRVTTVAFDELPAVAQERLERNFALIPGQARLWSIAPTPAVIWSIDGQPCQLLISEQPDVKVEGSGAAYQLWSDRYDAEVAIPVPENQIPAEIRLDGAPAGWRMAEEGGKRFALINFSPGTHQLHISYAPAPAAPESATLQVRQPGKQLLFSGTLAAASASDRFLLSIFDPNGAAVWSREITASGNWQERLDLPTSATDGTYRATLRSAGGQLLSECDFPISQAAQPTELEAILPGTPAQTTSTACTVTVQGMDVVARHTADHPDYGTAEVVAEELQIRVEALPMYTTHYNFIAGALELQKVKRYLKLRLDNGFLYFNVYGQGPGVHFVRYDDPNCFAGLFFDFGNRRRVGAGVGMQKAERTDPAPAWGAGARLPDELWQLVPLTSDAVNESVTMWVDLEALGAPVDWDGSLTLTAALEQICPGRFLQVTILENTDTAPADADFGTPVSLSRPLTGRVFPFDQWQPEALTRTGVGSPEEYPTRVEFSADDEALTVRFDCQESENWQPECERGALGQPWFSDSVECFFQRFDDPSRIVHIIVDAQDHTFMEERALEPENGGVRELNDRPIRRQIERDANHWRLTLTIPWGELGASGRPRDVRCAFNLMRNRALTGSMGAWSLAPGRGYFTGNLYQLEF